MGWIPSAIIVLMNDAVIYIGLALLGLSLGSFAGATVWRLRARQLVVDKAEGYPVDKSELKQLKKISSSKVKDDRSVCLHCGHELRWYDLIPLLSWLTLRGRCRYCHKSIGMLEPLVEIGLAAFFVVSFMFWPFELSSGLEITKFTMWLASGLGLAILFIYDAKWFLLPDVVMWPTIGLAAVYAGLTVYQSADPAAQAWSVIGAVAILSGLYLLLYEFSRWKNGEDGTWVGFGDVKLGLALALLLADWRLAFLALFLANLIGCLWVVPGLMTGKIERQSHVPFGPLLIAGFVVAGLFGTAVLDSYLGLFY